MSESNKYTVIIPTRERAETLRYTLRTAVEQEYVNLSIIVSDNFSQDNTQEVVASFSDTRVQYINTGKRVSMSENFEFGLNHISEGFVLFLGDDDGLLPGAIRRVNTIVEKTRARAVTSGIAQYVWPNHPDEHARNKMSWSIRNDVEIRHSSEWIRNVLSFRPLYTFDLPGLYCGFVHIDVINSMKKDGIFFRSQTPDAYSAFACAVALDTYAFSHRPFAIHGASGRSNGASYFHKHDNSESNKFFQENTIPFHSMLKVCPSYRVIASEAFLQLRDAFPDKTSSIKFDLMALLSAALSERNEYTRKSIDQAIIEIAALNKLNVKHIYRQGRRILPRIQRNLFELSKLFPLRAVYSGIPDSSLIGVFNIHDAAKTMIVFWGINDGAIISRYRYYLKRFISLFKMS
jgi:glycosyltransferase involved in cell wall biosynthesis